MPLNIALLGAGRMGKVFAETLAYKTPGARLAAIADPNEALAGEVAAHYGVKMVCADYRRALEDTGIEAVVIATPTATHANLVEAAAQAGKHIFCEKPLAQSLEGCDKAIQAARQAGVTLQVGFMRRFDPAYAAAKKKIVAGEIGHPVLFKSISRDPHRPSLQFARRESSGGLILDMGIHDFDLARWLMGSEVVRVFSEGDCLVFPELASVGDIDNAVISLKFENGAVGDVDVSRNAVYGYDIRTEVLGSEGSLQIGKDRQTALLSLTRQGVTHDTVPYFMERFGEAYAAEIQAFVECVRNGQPPIINGEDARLATAIGVAATLSLDEGRPVDVRSSRGLT